MKFSGQKKVITVDEHYGQIAQLEKFWEYMREEYPDGALCGLGANMSSATIDYYIGKISDEWHGGTDSIEIPDDGWITFRCELSDTEIEKMYRMIFRQGTPDYELESMKDGVFTTKIHFVKKEST